MHGHYKEIGEVGSISNTIKFDNVEEDGTIKNWQVDTEDTLEFVVRGDYSGTDN